MTHQEILNLVKNIVVSKITEINKHPNADRLTVIKVDIGAGIVKEVVTGAPNIEVGDYVAYLGEGKIVPGFLIFKGEKIALIKKPIRGVESDGMILADDEIGLRDDHTTMMKLSATDVDLGKSILEFLTEDQIKQLQNNIQNTLDASMHNVQRPPEHTYANEAAVEIQKIIFQTLKNIGIDSIQSQTEIMVEHPKEESHGDYSSNIAMIFAKSLKQNPMEIAEKIKTELIGQNSDIIDSVEVAKPGFINFKLSTKVFKSIIDEVLDKQEKFGSSEVNKGKTFLVEHTSPNPNKEFHLGHLKNNVTGLALSYLFEATGTKVFRDCINNNRGIAIARLMWGYLKFARKSENTPIDLMYWYDHKEEWHTPESIGLKPDRFMDQLYTKASTDCKENTESESIVRQMVVDWEAEEPKNWALWEMTQTWVWEGYKRSISRVNGFKFDKIWNEHELYKKGKEHVERGLKEGVFKQLPDGAVLTDFKKFGITDTILIKNDGTSLYITQDLELTSQKRKTFNPDEMFWIIGPEQSLAMKQMFAACSQLGFGKYEDFHHIPYGFVLIKAKNGEISKMSSRSGTQIYVDDLIDMAKEEIKKYIKKDFSDAEKDNISEKVAIAAIKYALLRVGRTTDQAFIFEETISLEGDSGPYLLYTYARANSITKDQKLSTISYELSAVLNDETELDILKHLNKFQQTIENAAQNYAPNLISNYLYDLAQKFNKFYNTLSILNAESEEQKQSRVALTEAVKITLKNGLALLGIQTVEKM